jgi:hypothetical protein
MSTNISKIVSRLIEDDDDDAINQADLVPEDEIVGWTERDNRGIPNAVLYSKNRSTVLICTVPQSDNCYRFNVLTKSGKSVDSYVRSNETDYVWDALVQADKVIAQGEAARKVNEDEDDDAIDQMDLMPTYAGYDLIRELINEDAITLNGRVTRHSTQYVHERTTSLDIEFRMEMIRVGGPEEYNAAGDYEYAPDPREEDAGKLVDALEEEIKQNMLAWNQAIYRQLEEAYDYSVSDDVVEESIRANEYTFDAFGNRDNDEDLQYDQLSDAAKKKARERYVNSNLEAGDNYWAEYVIDEWKELLEAKGFDSPKINYSGFYSQGDGASFICDSIDFTKYLTGPDPMEAFAAKRNPVEESKWAYTIHAFPTCKSISYSLGESKQVGGQTFPHKMNDADLKRIAETQIKQFNKTGQFDPSKWKDVWQWLADARNR